MVLEGKIFPYRRKIKKLFEVAGRVLCEDFAGVNVSVNFVSEEEIKKLNNEFRKIDKVTDVLSFPNLNKASNQKQAKRQAKEFGHSEKREICFLALHGLLHLLGYDHIEKADEKIMMETAEKILNAFGAKR